MARGKGLALSFVILKALAEEAEGQQEDQEDAVSEKGRECFQMECSRALSAVEGPGEGRLKTAHCVEQREDHW